MNILLMLERPKAFMPKRSEQSHTSRSESRKKLKDDLEVAREQVHDNGKSAAKLLFEKNTQRLKYSQVGRKRRTSKNG